MIGAKLGLIIGGVAAGAAFFTGYTVGGRIVAADYTERLLSEMEGTSLILTRKDGEIKQCQEQIDKVNRSLAEQGRKFERVVAKDRAARDRARKDQLNENEQSRLRLDRALTALEEIGEVIQSETFKDECAGADVDTRIVSLLNDALDPEGSDNADGGGGVPAGEGDD